MSLEPPGSREPAASKNDGFHELPKKLRVCELFAGIGGWRVALEKVLPAGVKLEIKAFDSGPHCSDIYAHNFGELCCRRNIEQLELSVFEGFDVWVMSPPCQPFSTTREAKQRDLGDRRCAALEHLCGVLPRLARPPRWIALENVKGFHNSNACNKWQAALRDAGFSSQHFLLDLVSFGIPNHRTRYYLLAERSSRFAATARKAPEITAEDAPAEVQELLPPGAKAMGSWARSRRAEIEEAHRQARKATCRESKEKIFADLRTSFCKTLAELLDSAADTSEKNVSGDLTCAPVVKRASAVPRKSPGSLPLSGKTNWKLLPLPKGASDSFLVVFEGGHNAAQIFLADIMERGAKPGVAWSLSKDAAPEPRQISEFLESSLNSSEHNELVVPLSVLSRPFARGLSYVEPTHTCSFCFTGHYGKVLHKASGSLLHTPTDRPLDRGDLPAAFGNVRFFSPKEILNILGFPKGFRLNPDMELKHRYKVVGNSIAVTVAAELLRVLLLGKDMAHLLQLECPVGSMSDPPQRTKTEEEERDAHDLPKANACPSSRVLILLSFCAVLGISRLYSTLKR